MALNKNKRLPRYIITGILFLLISVEGLFLIKAYQDKKNNESRLSDLKTQLDYLSKEYSNTKNEISKYQSEIKDLNTTK